MKWFLVVMVIAAAAKPNQATTFTVTEQVFLDIMIGDRPAGRLVIGLFGDLAPKTVKNFVTLATTGVAGKTYIGTRFHRVVKKFIIQGGDIENGDGTGSISIYGKYFEDENLDAKFSSSGFVGMANAGKNTNGCQFFITTIATPWLDGEHTIFGKVVDGEDLIFKIEQVKTDNEDRPISPVTIHKSGVLPLKSSFTVSDDPYNLWAWIKATSIPLGFSFSILAFFHWMMKQLDI